LCSLFKCGVVTNFENVVQSLWSMCLYGYDYRKCGFVEVN
jgi:hypothetical protein